MGYEASCTIRFEGQTAKGNARLEHKDLIFRGPTTRVAIPLREIRDAHAGEGTLYVTFGGKRAEFDLGAVASRWASRIANPPSRLDKLGVKPGAGVIVLGVEDTSFVNELKGRGAIVTGARGTAVDIAFYAANRRDDLGALASLKNIIKPNGAIWVVRPKGQDVITEAETMAAGKRAGLVDVKVVSFSDTHTAEKFVIPVKDRPKAAPPGSSRTTEARRAAPGRSASPSRRRRGSSPSRGRT
jgi:hypothetical protein